MMTLCVSKHQNASVIFEIVRRTSTIIIQGELPLIYDLSIEQN